MRQWQTLLATVIAAWTGVFVVRAQLSSDAEIATLHQLKNLTPQQAAEGIPARIKGVVVCYDAGWHQLYINDNLETSYFNADDFAVQPEKGQIVEITGKARGTNTLENPKLTILGKGTLPEAKRLDLSRLAQDHGEWIEVEGTVMSTESSRRRLSLLLYDKGHDCLVYILGSPPTNEFKQWLNHRVQLRGINASRMSGAALESGLVFVPGADEVKVLKTADNPSPVPVTSIRSLLNRELGSWTNDWVHINGLVISYQPGQAMTIKDPTGVIRARVIQLTEIRGDERVDVQGFLEAGPDETFLNHAYFEVTQPSPGPASVAPPVELSRVARLPSLLTNMADILKLRADEAAQHLAVRLRGVMTFADADWRNGYLQDRGDAVYVELDPSWKNIRSGQWVEVTGQTSPGGFAPEVHSSEIKVLKTTSLPAPAKVDLEDLANGHFDSHWVEMEGLVQRVDELPGHASLDLMTSKGRFKVVIPGFENRPVPSYLIDAMVSVQGACTSELNGRRQLSGITLRVPSLDQIKIIDPPPADPFAIATTQISNIATFNPDRFAGRRVKIQGVVTLRLKGEGFILQDASGGMRVLTRQTNEVELGDLTEVIGFPAIGNFSPFLDEAVFHVIGKGPIPAAKSVTADEILLHGANDGQIVTLDARLLQNVPKSANPQLVLQEGPIIFTAQLGTQNRQGFPDLKSGSRLRLTGVCSIQGGEGHEPQAFGVFLRAPDDAKLLEPPPFWTAERSFALAGGMMLVVSAALGWVALLRRQVRNQTKLIRQKLEDEAALEERYRELFENATDMLYTHDREGRITSINQTGERLLERSRRQLLGRNILEFVTAEQRDSVQQWLSRLLKGATMSDMEWDVVAASGERVKLEISARLIEREDRELEVEGIARDITERKRLEREILEISNREQRRIGHDLHDGVCQQLAGIAFMTSTLAEELTEEGASCSAQAERISVMINEVIDQTRGVARGLFPVRLDEKGLVASLEELATNASEAFKIQCAFALEGPPVTVENEIALHLYYIVLEAVANAAKHSGASTIEIALQPVGDRWLLSVRDTGCGFSLAETNQDGMGLRILRYRARVIGATLSLQSQPGSGTTVSCHFLPVSGESPRGVASKRAHEGQNQRQAIER